MDSDESSDDSHTKKFNNNLDDPKLDLVVQKTSGVSLQDNQMPGPRKADRAVSHTTDEAAASDTDEAVSPTTDEAEASDTDVGVSPTRDEAEASNTDEAVSPITGEAEASDTDEAVSPTRDEAVSPTTDETVVPNTGGTGNNTGGSNGHHPDTMVGTGHHIGGTGCSRQDASLTYGTGQSPDVTNGGRHFQSNTGSSEQLHNGSVGNGLDATGGTIHVEGESNHFKFTDMQPGWVELFQRYGTDVIKDIEKEYNVNIAHSGSGQYHVCGEKKDEAETLMKKKVSVKEFKVEEPSACDILASQDGDLFLREAEDTCKCIIKIKDKTNHPLQWENKPFYYDGWCQSHSNKRITLVLGRLCDLEARMVVIPSNGCYYPLKDFGDCFKGEKEVMQKCIDQFSDGSQTNKMNLWTTFFNNNTCSLPYSIICHAVLFDNENGEQKEHAKKNLKQVYKRVLEKAKTAHLNSLAIPLCNYGGPSVDDQIYAIKKTIKHYLAKPCCQNTRLDEIVLCVAEKKEADLVHKMMEDLLRQLEGGHLARLVFDVSRKLKGLTNQRKNRIQVKIEYGQLHEMDANVLVNTTSLDLDLKQGTVSKAILDAAGPKLQEECRKEKSLLNLGEFVITGPGKLNTCKLIFHGSLPMWDSTPAKCEQVLKSFVKKCLLDASRRKMKSIAFPSLGTGQLKFPWHQVARAMYESVNEFERENEKTNLEMVMFVIHPKDKMSKEAFIVEEKRQNAIKILKSEKRSVQQCRNDKETLEGVLRSNSKVVKIMVCEGDMTEEPFDCTLIRMEKCEHGEDSNCPTEIVKYYSAAISDSSQLHNEFKIHVRDEEGHLYRVLHNVFYQAMMKRHTVLSFEVNKWFSKMSAGAMVEQFIKALIYQESLQFLLEVHIFIDSAMDLANIESHVNAMNIKKSLFSFPSLASFTGSEEKEFDYVKMRMIAKKICHYPQPPFEVSIQGFSVESCQEAMAKIKKHVSGSEADSLDNNDGMDDDDDVITSVFESVSAEVNPGFLTSCSDTGFQGALKTKTKVKVINKNGRVFIKGTIDQILSSEKLMFLPDEQEEFKFEDGHFQDEANPADLKFPASLNEYLAIIHTLKIAESGITQMKYNEGCIRITCNKNLVSELQGKISSQLSQVRSSHWDEIYLNQGEEITSELPQNDLVMVLYVKEERKVILFSSSKEQLDLVKHKIMVQLRRLTLTGGSRKLRSLKTGVESDSSLFYSLDSKTIPSKNTFLTEKGMIIKVYSMPITETDVECIVNATDTQLRNSFGVSKAIADAAGKGFKAACDEHIRLHGPLKRVDAIVFLPGSLKCRCIISIAGPAKFKRDEIYMALSDLENIIVESLKVADGRGLKSIAFPSVCAGLAGLDAELCAQQYYRSVNRFVQQTKSPLNLKEIHFVDIKTSMTQIIQATFTKHFSPQTANFLSNSIKESSSFPASVLSLEKDAADHTKGSSIPTAETNTDGMMSSERGIKDGDGMFYYPHEKTTIKLASDNICDIETDALVSIEDANGSGNGQIAKALLVAAGSRYQDVEHSKVKMAKRSITEVVVTGSGRLKCEFVLHAIAPEWGVETTRENQSFQKNVEKTMMNIMDAAFEKKVKCIAVPLIGIFNGTSKVPLTICCEAMIAGLDMWIQSHSQEYQFKEVILICSNPIASKCFANLLSAKRKEDIKGGRSTRGIPLTSSELQPKSDESITSSSNIQSKENCVICMESITDPKVLPKCGHTFCRECIEQQFLYKPACPCCGVVYGKITGSQPNGTMQVFYEKYCLPGFEGCSTIVIFYEFTGGTQKAEHPHPGRPYNGTKRKAYLPNNKKGKLVLRLLTEAFNRRLVFTIGTSRTTGQEDTVTWNDIHHKTNRDGGPQKFGYPDPTYLDRVMEELAVKGITEESL